MERLFRRNGEQRADVSSIYGTITLYDPTRGRKVYGQPGDCENEDSLNGWVKVLSIYGVISGYQRGV